MRYHRALAPTPAVPLGNNSSSICLTSIAHPHPRLSTPALWAHDRCPEAPQSKSRNPAPGESSDIRRWHRHIAERRLERRCFLINPATHAQREKMELAHYPQRERRAPWTPIDFRRSVPRFRANRGAADTDGRWAADPRGVRRRTGACGVRTACWRRGDNDHPLSGTGQCLSGYSAA